MFGAYVVEYFLGSQRYDLQHFTELHHKNQSATKDFNHIQQNISQLLISADLIFGSKETFLINGAIEQSKLLIEQLNTLLVSAQIFEENKFLESTIKDITLINELLIKVYGTSQINEEEHFSGLLKEYDKSSIVLVNKLEILSGIIISKLQDDAIELEKLNQSVILVNRISIIAFSILILFLWYWANKAISKPLQSLSKMATTVNKTGHFHGIEKGPKEVMILSHELSILTNSLLHQANHDPLTNLLNRREFERQLSQTHELVRIEKDNVANMLCYIDLDRFKIVNDTCGHAAGDELLTEVAQILASNARTTDVIARVGGDEFTLLLRNCNLDSAIELGERILKKIEDLCFTSGKYEFHISASLGLTLINGREENYQEIINTADSACRIAKESGRNQVQILEIDDERAGHKRREMLHLNQIINAIDESRLVLFFQDIVPLDRNYMSGKHYEILIRLKTEDGELLSPHHFLPIIERYQLCTRLDKWVVYETIKLLSENPEELGLLELCSINLSGQSFSNKPFRQFIFDTLKEFNFPGNKLSFEITETEAISDIEMAKEFMNELKELNVRFALDDFGTGHSSFEYLKNLPVDYIKIDGGFVKSMCENPADFETVKSITDVGKALGKKLIAEYVHSEEIVEMLIDLKIDFAQGYNFSEPCELKFEPQPLYQVING